MTHLSSRLSGGVNASARFNTALRSAPRFHRAHGAVLVDEAGRSFIDLCASNGAILLGHGDAGVREAVASAMNDGVLCGYEHPRAEQLALRLCQLIPSAETVRFSGSGTEAVASAVRIARGFTGRSAVVKIDGHFHGYSDVLGFNMGRTDAGDPPRLVPESAGLAPRSAEWVEVVAFNDIAAVESALRRRGHDIAAVVLEPVAYNAGTLLPEPGYLEQLRELTTGAGSLLIFDEVLSGFRTGTSCVQGLSGVSPDLTILGKALAAGAPLSAIVGRRDIMDVIAPGGPVQHSGTYLGHAIGTAAALAVLDTITPSAFFEDYLGRCERFYAGLRARLDRTPLRVDLRALGGRFSLHFGLRHDARFRCWQDVAGQDSRLRDTLIRELYARGVYMHTNIHHGLMNAHTHGVLDELLTRFDDALTAVERGPRA
jgi:glutamate-1-semialdehyde 2,1-aminomutase